MGYRRLKTNGILVCLTGLPIWWVAVAGALMSVTNPVRAQIAELGREQQHRTKDARDTGYEPVGARFGVFRVLPRLEFGALWDDNVFATEADERSDTIFRAAPSVRLTADTSRYLWDIRADLEHLEFDEFEDESRTNYGAGTTIATEILRDTTLRGRLNYDLSHEDRGDPNSQFTNVEPTEFTTLDTGVSFERAVSRLIVGADLDYRKIDYDDVRRINGTIENGDDRDRSLTSVGGKVGYELSPGYRALLRAFYHWVDYDEAVDDLGFDRSSDGLRITGGIRFELTRLLTGEIFAGYLRRTYDDARFKTINEPTFGAGLSWSPTELTTVRLNADRSVEETIFSGYQAYLSSSASLRLEHELSRQISINGGVQYSNLDYVRSIGSTTLPRDDDYYGASVGVRYRLNRLLYALAGYEWYNRETNALDTDFKRNRLRVAVGAQF